MYLNEIIVTTDSLRSNYMEDIIDSNVNFLEKLFKVNIRKDEVSKEAMKSYYVDFYHQNISKYGFTYFLYLFYTNKNLITNIEHALYHLNCHQNLFIFKQVIHFVNRLNQFQDISYLLELEYQYKEEKLFNFFDKKFQTIRKKENLIEKNYSWLMEHPKLVSIQKHLLKNKLLEVHLNILER